MTRSLATSLLIASIALATGCDDVDEASQNEMAASTDGEGSEVSAALQHTMPPYVLESPREFVRLQLRRGTDGAISVLEAKHVTLTQLPVPTLQAEYMVEARDGERTVYAVPLAFLDTLRETFRLPNGRYVHEYRKLSTVTMSAFIEVDPQIDTIAVTAPGGAVEVSLSIDEVEGARSEREQPREGKVRKPESEDVLQKDFGSSVLPLTIDDLRQKFPSIRFLEPGDEDVLDADAIGTAKLAGGPERARDSVAEGLSALPPALLSSITTVGLVDWPTGGDDTQTRMGASRGAVLLLNANLRNAFDRKSTVVHEAAHCFAALLDAAAPGGSSEHWPEAVQVAAAERVRAYHLARGLDSVWAELHRTGQSGDLTWPYHERNWELSESRAVRGGFATPRGGTSAEEDFAEYVASTTLHPDRAAPVCTQFESGERLKERGAIPYAKLALARGIGAIDGSTYDACVRHVAIEPEAGVHVAGVVDFESNVKGGVVDIDGQRFIRVLAEGPNTYRLLLEVALANPRVGALGLHRLDDVWFFNLRDSGLSGAYLANDDPVLSRAAEQGLMLVTSAVDRRIEGAVFGLVLQNALGFNTDDWPFITFSAGR